MTGILLVQGLCAVGLIATGICMVVASATRRPRPARLIPDGSSALTAPRTRMWGLPRVASPLLAGINSVLIGLSASRTITEPGLGGERTALVAMSWTAAATCAVSVVTVVVRWRRYPPVTVTAAGVRCPMRLVTWETLAARPTLPRNFPSATTRPGSGRFVDMDADPRFVHAVIEYYRDRPAERSAIGTVDGYGRLEYWWRRGESNP